MAIPYALPNALLFFSLFFGTIYIPPIVLFGEILYIIKIDGGVLVSSIWLNNGGRSHSSLAGSRIPCMPTIKCQII